MWLTGDYGRLGTGHSKHSFVPVQLELLVIKGVRVCVRVP
jgi:hypothetical protein